MFITDCWPSECEQAAVFHSNFTLSTSEEQDLPLQPLPNHQITIIKMVMAANPISSSVCSHKNLLIVFFGIIANHSWCIFFSQSFSSLPYYYSYLFTLVSSPAVSYLILSFLMQPHRHRIRLLSHLEELHSRRLHTADRRHVRLNESRTSCQLWIHDTISGQADSAHFWLSH